MDANWKHLAAGLLTSLGLAFGTRRPKGQYQRAPDL